MKVWPGFREADWRTLFNVYKIFSTLIPPSEQLVQQKIVMIQSGIVTMFSHILGDYSVFGSCVLWKYFCKLDSAYKQRFPFAGGVWLANCVGIVWILGRASVADGNPCYDLVTTQRAIMRTMGVMVWWNAINSTNFVLIFNDILKSWQLWNVTD